MGWGSGQMNLVYWALFHCFQAFLVTSEIECSVWNPEHSVNTWRVEAFAGFLILMNRGVWALILPFSAYPIGSWMSQPYSMVPCSFPTRFSIQIPQAFQNCCSYIKWALLQSNVFTDRIFALHIVWTTLTSNASSRYFRRVIQKGFTT